MKKILSVIIAVFMFAVVVAPALATQVEGQKVGICHTGNGKNWESVEVDKDAWDEHESAHSDHELDFLITEESTCPPADTDVCENIEGTQATLPEDKIVNEEGDCVDVPGEPKDSTDSATPIDEETPPVDISTAEVETLPDTGNNTVLMVLGSLAVLGSAWLVIRRLTNDKG